MEDASAQGLIWSLSIVVMPILLGLAIAYGAYQTWRRRRAGHPKRREHGHIDNVHDRSPQAENRQIGTIAVLAIAAFVVLGAILLFFYA